MAIQSIPLANSLYLAMLSQERQDHSRRIQKEEADMLRRDNNMRDTQNYILKVQDQKMQYEREREEMALKRRAQLMQERIEQAGMMERRQAQDRAALGRTLIGRQGRDLDRQQREDAAKQRDFRSAESNRLRGEQFRLKRQDRQSMEAEKLALSTANNRVRSLATDAERIRRALKDATDRQLRGSIPGLKEDAVKANEALRRAMGEFKGLQDSFTARYTPHLLDPLRGHMSGGDTVEDEVTDTGGSSQGTQTNAYMNR